MYSIYQSSLCNSTSTHSLSSGICSRALSQPRRLQRLTTCVYQNGSQGPRNAPVYQNGALGNTPSANNRAALQERIGVPIDVSREAVTTQTVPIGGVRKSYRVSVIDAMKVFGPAPERVNGRLAMLGFLLGTIGEFRTGTPLLQQAQAIPIQLAVLFLLISWASLIPICKGARSEAFGAFSPRAEITNGRAAMLGITAIGTLEYLAGASFF